MTEDGGKISLYLARFVRPEILRDFMTLISHVTMAKMKIYGLTEICIPNQGPRNVSRI